MCRVVVEMLRLADDGTQWTFQAPARAALGDRVHPDQVALRLAGDVGMCHSTSWRWEGGAVVLTYAAVVDELTNGRPVGQIVSSGDPRVPSPRSVAAGDVAAHAVWHLGAVAGRVAP